MSTTTQITLTETPDGRWTAYNTTTDAVTGRSSSSNRFYEANFWILSMFSPIEYCDRSHYLVIDGSF